MSILDNCPCCGSEAHIVPRFIKSRNWFAAVCSNDACGMRTNLFQTEETAAGVWNRRDGMREPKS